MRSLVWLPEVLALGPFSQEPIKGRSAQRLKAGVERIFPYKAHQHFIDRGVLVRAHSYGVKQYPILRNIAQYEQTLQGDEPWTHTLAQL